MQLTEARGEGVSRKAICNHLDNIVHRLGALITNRRRQFSLRKRHKDEKR